LYNTPSVRVLGLLKEGGEKKQKHSGPLEKEGGEEGKETLSL